MPKGVKVKVISVFKSECGCWNIIFENSNYELDCNELKCICGKINYPHPQEEIFGQIGWLASSFRSLQESPFPSLTWSKVLEKNHN